MALSLFCRNMFKLPNASEIPSLTASYIAKSDELSNKFLKSEPTVKSLRQWFLDNNQMHALSNQLTFGQHVSTNEQVRVESRLAQQQLQQYHLDVYQNVALFNHINTILQPVFNKSVLVKPNEYKLFTDLHRDFVHNGLLLNDSDRQRVKSLKKELQDLSLEFSKSVADDKSTILFTKDQLQGMSDAFLNALEKDGDLYIITMKYPDVLPIFDQCQVEETRKSLDKVYSSRCPENIPRLQAAIKKRLELAQLLGYTSFSCYQLTDRMAKHPSTVWHFLNDLKSQLLPHGKEDLARLEALKGSPLNSWDYRYYHNLLKIKEYKVNEVDIQAYFPLQHVLKGIFNVYQSLFDLTISKVMNEASWHPDVTVYKVTDATTGALYGHFYADLFPRAFKYSHAACFNLQSACVVDNNYQPSLAALVANFTKPTTTTPSLLQHNEVVTLAHELGHVLHVMCSVVDYADQQGTNTAWDFVECPSQMLENFIYEPDVLRQLSSHVERKEPLPDHLIDQIIKARNVNASLFHLRQLFFGIFDMTVHDQKQLEGQEDVNGLYARLREEITLLPHHKGTCGAATFNHIMGGYQSGYYGYLWSLVYASDIYSCFQDAVNKKEIGKRYRDEILKPGGSLDALEMIKGFLHREPNNEAFLAHLGLKK